MLINKFRQFFLVLLLSTAFVSAAYAGYCGSTGFVSMTNSSDFVWTKTSPTSSAMSGAPESFGPGAVITFDFAAHYGGSDETETISYKANGAQYFVTLNVVVGSSDLSGSVSPGANYAKSTGSNHQGCEVGSTVGFEFLRPPKQRVEVNIDFQSSHHANIASMSIEEFFDPKLLEGLDIAHGKPFDISVHDNIVKLLFEKVCAVDACGY